jgi:hypothetical protein
MRRSPSVLPTTAHEDGEVCSLQWRQITWTEGELYLRAQDTKTNTRGCSFSQAIFIESCGRGRPGVTTSGPPARESAIEEGFAYRRSATHGGKRAKR